MLFEDAPALTLVDEKRQATLDRILRSTQRALRRRGLAVTVDDVAAEASMNRRTIFRHFSTREELLAAAVRDAIGRYEAQLPPYRGGDWQLWLHELAAVVHRMNDTYGPAFWELATGTNLADELVSVEQSRVKRRRSSSAELARTAWVASGGRGRTPKIVVLTFSAYLSPFFTAAVTRDGGEDWHRAAQLSEQAILRCIADAAQPAAITSVSSPTAITTKGRPHR